MSSEFITDLVSVVVPAYNVEDYIVQCVNSICNQTYDKLEIIIVDDGSTDNTGRICDELSDNRITVIHQENQGLSGARNTALEIAQGEYICFVDSDDYIRESMIEELYKCIVGEKYDFAACGVEYLMHDTGLSTYSGNSGKKKELDYVESLDYLSTVYLFNVWNKIYRHDVIKDIRFVRGVVCEDVGYMREVFSRINSTVFLDKPLYVYRVKRPGSSGMVFDPRKLPAIDEYERFIEYLSNNGYKNAARKIRNNQLALIKSLYCETTDSDSTNRKQMYKIFFKKVFKNNAWIINVRSNLAFVICPGISRKKRRAEVM